MEAILIDGSGFLFGCDCGLTCGCQLCKPDFGYRLYKQFRDKGFSLFRFNNQEEDIHIETTSTNYIGS